MNINRKKNGSNNNINDNNKWGVDLVAFSIVNLIKIHPPTSLSMLIPLFRVTCNNFPIQTNLL